ncbi:hypothetical protein I3843_15G056700 [Carya illinoinensis]|nr:hypothetical protein I3843_15G056700 [Carya illinoinensis]
MIYIHGRNSLESFILMIKISKRSVQFSSNNSLPLTCCHLRNYTKSKLHSFTWERKDKQIKEIEGALKRKIRNEDETKKKNSQEEKKSIKSERDRQRF